jgi:hypothetical protein
MSKFQVNKLNHNDIIADDVHVNQKECHLDVSDKNSISIPLSKLLFSRKIFIN